MKSPPTRRPGLVPVLTALALALAAPWEAAALVAEATNGAALWPAAATAPSGAVGSLVATPDGCLIDYSIAIVTDGGGGSDAFEIQVADDGQVVQIIPLSAPADGQQHQVTGSFRLGRQPGHETPGIGLYLIDDGHVLDILDPLGGIGCSPLEVPALDRGGFAALGGLLALAAFFALRRLRRART